jgi:hypothetical protein
MYQGNWKLNACKEELPLWGEPFLLLYSETMLGNLIAALKLNKSKQ